MNIESDSDINIPQKLPSHIRVSVWINKAQQYVPCGTILIDDNHRTGFGGFLYDEAYLRAGFPCLDPSNLPVNRIGMANSFRDGTLPPTFKKFLPSSHICHTFYDTREDWESLTELQQLYAISKKINVSGPLKLDRLESQSTVAFSSLDEGVSFIERINSKLHTEGLSQVEINSTCGITTDLAICRFRDSLSGSLKYLKSCPVNFEATMPRIQSEFEKVKKQMGIRTADCIYNTYNDAQYLITKSIYEKNKTMDSGKSIKVNFLNVSFEELNYSNKHFEMGSPCYSDVLKLIDMYSDMPNEDKKEAISRLVLSALSGSNVTLRDFELYNYNENLWRLAPSTPDSLYLDGHAKLSIFPDHTIQTRNHVTHNFGHYINSVSISTGLNDNEAKSLVHSTASKINDCLKALENTTRLEKEFVRLSDIRLSEALKLNIKPKQNPTSGFSPGR